MFYSSLLRKNKKAFSLVELSIVIVIIGVLIAGVVGSKHLISKSRIITAQAMTRSSPINGTLNNRLWLETSLAEVSLGENLKTGDAIISWRDNSNNNNPITISLPTGSSGPTYSNSINNIQAVKFGDNSATDYLQIDNAEFFNGTNYTIFITEKRLSTNSGDGNYFLGSAGSFAVGYESENTIIQTHGESASIDNQANIEGTDSYINKPRVIVFTHSNVDGNKIYINGTLANEDTTSNAKAHLSGLETLAIGNNYNGEIGEIVIFDRELKTVERREIEDYLTDKWDAPNNRDSNSSCVTGTVTSTGCDETSCAAPTINGATTSITSNGGTAEFTCNATGYSSNTLTYTCSSGSLSPTPSSSDCADVGCDDGYNEDNGACKSQCTINSVNGISDGTKVNSGSSSYSCNDTGYSGNITYTCNDGVFSIASNDCTSITCDLDAAAIPGVTQTGTVSAGSGTLTCDDTNFDGQDINYTCNSSGEFENVGTCNCGNIPLYLSNGSSCEDTQNILWLDASDSSTITHSSNVVSQWNDKSGGGKNVTQGTSTRQPLIVSAAQNGLSVIRFDGSDSLMLASPGLLMNSSGATIIAVAKSNATSSYGTLATVTRSGSNNQARAGLYQNNLAYESGGRRLDGNAYSGISGGSVSTGSYHIVMGKYDYANSDLYIYLDGSLLNSKTNFQTDGNTSNTNPNYLAIGGNSALNSEFLNGDIGEILIYNKVLSDDEVSEINSYLTDKWGL